MLPLMKYLLRSVVIASLAVGVVACSETGSSGSDVYQACIEYTKREAKAQNDGPVPEDLLQQTAETICGAVKEECDRYPDGGSCEAYEQLYLD
jgi:hypothetical protein